MDEPKLWIVGAAAVVLIVAALVWVLRQRGEGSRPAPHPRYDAPQVMEGRAAGATGLTFGEDAGGGIDSTVPLSRLGGAGWRDGGGVPPEPTTDTYAGRFPSSGEDESSAASDTSGPQVEVDATIPRSALGTEADRERGGHW
jgi:hypothetical protein